GSVGKAVVATIPELGVKVIALPATQAAMNENDSQAPGVVAMLDPKAHVVVMSADGGGKIAYDTDGQIVAVPSPAIPSRLYAGGVVLKVLGPRAGTSMTWPNGHVVVASEYVVTSDDGRFGAYVTTTNGKVDPAVIHLVDFEHESDIIIGEPIHRCV